MTIKERVNGIMSRMSPDVGEHAHTFLKRFAETLQRHLTQVRREGYEEGVAAASEVSVAVTQAIHSMGQESKEVKDKP